MSGPVPFGLRREGGRLVPEETEAAVVRAIAEAFVSTGGRMKSTAAALNAQGLRTRKGVAWADVSVARALRVICDNGLVDPALRDRCTVLLAERCGPEGAPTRRSSHPLGGVVHCGACSGRLYCVGSGGAAKFVCSSCRAKVAASTLERVFEESLAWVSVTAQEVVAALAEDRRAAELSGLVGDQPVTLAVVWPALDLEERRQLVDVAVERIVVGSDLITVVFGLKAESMPVSAGSVPSTLPSPFGFDAIRDRATGQGDAESGRTRRHLPHSGRDADAAQDRHRAAPACVPETLPPLITVGGVASLLHTSRKAVYTMTARGQLRGAIRVGRRLLFRRDELLDSLRGSRAPSPKEVRR